MATQGDGPPVLFLHGFPEFWWAWRHQLGAVADSGHAGWALDVRGAGASDKPPSGYDLVTACADASGVIRSLGAESAVIVGHGLGASVAWLMPYLAPQVTRAVAVIGMDHPVVSRRALARSRLDRDKGGSRELPRRWVSEKVLASDPTAVLTILRECAAPTGRWPSLDEAQRYAEAMRLPMAARGPAEMQRWVLRASLTSQGWSLARRIAGPVTVPTLLVRGASDPLLSAERAERSAAHVVGPLATVTVPDAGHFTHEEAPDVVSAALVDWLRTIP